MPLLNVGWHLTHFRFMCMGLESLCACLCKVYIEGTGANTGILLSEPKCREVTSHTLRSENAFYNSGFLALAFLT